MCANGTGHIGCGPQEEFRACADIRITDREPSSFPDRELARTTLMTTTQSTTTAASLELTTMESTTSRTTATWTTPATKSDTARPQVVTPTGRRNRPTFTFVRSTTTSAIPTARTRPTSTTRTTIAPETPETPTGSDSSMELHKGIVIAVSMSTLTVLLVFGAVFCFYRGKTVWMKMMNGRPFVRSFASRARRQSLTSMSSTRVLKLRAQDSSSSFDSNMSSSFNDERPSTRQMKTHSSPLFAANQTPSPVRLLTLAISEPLDVMINGVPVSRDHI